MFYVQQITSHHAAPIAHGPHATVEASERFARAVAQGIAKRTGGMVQQERRAGGMVLFTLPNGASLASGMTLAGYGPRIDFDSAD